MARRKVAETHTIDQYKGRLLHEYNKPTTEYNKQIQQEFTTNYYSTYIGPSINTETKNKTYIYSVSARANFLNNAVPQYAYRRELSDQIYVQSNIKTNSSFKVSEDYKHACEFLYDRVYQSIECWLRMQVIKEKFKPTDAIILLTSLIEKLTFNQYGILLDRPELVKQIFQSAPFYYHDPKVPLQNPNEMFIKPKPVPPPTLLELIKKLQEAARAVEVHTKRNCIPLSVGVKIDLAPLNKEMSMMGWPIPPYIMPHIMGRSMTAAEYDTKREQECDT